MQIFSPASSDSIVNKEGALGQWRKIREKVGMAARAAAAAGEQRMDSSAGRRIWINIIDVDVEDRQREKREKNIEIKAMATMTTAAATEFLLLLQCCHYDQCSPTIVFQKWRQ